LANEEHIAALPTRQLGLDKGLAFSLTGGERYEDKDEYEDCKNGFSGSCHMRSLLVTVGFWSEKRWFHLKKREPENSRLSGVC